MKGLSMRESQPKRILTKASGFLAGYSHTLNPYVGCSFACSYCYVRQMPVQLFQEEEWGNWVTIKRDIASLLEKEIRRAKNHGPVTIFMSSSTDPYQPIEHRERVTRSLLEAMVREQPDFLFIQTRGALVTRDMDLLKRLGNRVRVSMTIETDSDAIRKQFAPQAPPIQGRVKALQCLKENGIPIQATVAPLLPSSKAFPEMLADVVDRVCIDDFFMGDGSGGKRTEKLKMASLYTELGLEKWYERDAIWKVKRRFLKYFSENQLFISKEGFLP
ncbi:SPL family radical SAM protein [Shouchella hunanensis]|uniref:Radical SAM protein n=1 Tax=Shouchella hunanensis TaxID=766894 RepID=A0ABY7WCB0_9BACI|nr:radical SAM protein [Shouchella hunanensis]WDF05264.1 radical SAM protein [Shouchella hunanensis]